MYLNNNALTSPEQWVLVKDTTFIIEKLSVHSLFIVLSFLLGHIAARMLRVGGRSVVDGGGREACNYN